MSFWPHFGVCHFRVFVCLFLYFIFVFFCFHCCRTCFVFRVVRRGSIILPKCQNATEARCQKRYVLYIHTNDMTWHALPDPNDAQNSERWSHSENMLKNQLVSMGVFGYFRFQINGFWGSPKWPCFQLGVENKLKTSPPQNPLIRNRFYINH